MNNNYFYNYNYNNNLLFIIIIHTLLFINYTEQTWQNEAGKKLHVDCPKNHGIFEMKNQIQYFNSGSRDHLFYFGCKEVARSINECYWTDAPDLDTIFDYESLWKKTCNENEFVAGVESEYSIDDRRWKIKCCSFNGIEISSCTTTGYINDPGQTFHYSVAGDEFFTGFENYRIGYKG